MEKDIYNKIVEKLLTMYPEEMVYKLSRNEDLQYAGIDSLAFIQLIVFLEEEYGIIFDDEMLDLNILSSINAIISCIIQKIN